VGLITPHRTYLTITKARKGRPRPGPGCSVTDDDGVYVLTLLNSNIINISNG
jgi:hypothetical protein